MEEKNNNKPDREKPGKHTKPMARGKKALMIAGIVVLVLAVLVVVYAIWERPPEIAPTPTAKPTSAPVQTDKPTGPAQTADPAHTADPSQPAETPAQPEETPEAVDADALVTDRDSDKYTILLVGRDFASNSTDTLIVARLDTKAHTIDCVSIPRDTLINISWASTPKKINAVYPGYYNSGNDPVAGIKGEIRNLLGFEVDCYSVVDIKAVEDAVDCVGGIWFDVPQDMRYWDPTQDLLIDIKAGYQLLNGSDAVKLCRFRNGYAGGDLERIGVQQSFLKAAAKQMLSLGNIPNLGTLAKILSENVDTDLTAANIAWFARQFLLCKMEDIHFYTMPYGSTCYINGISYVSVDQDAWLEMINSSLNPYKESVTAANVNLLMSNYSGSSVWSTTGVVAGGVGSFYCQQCTVNNGGKYVCHIPGAHLDFGGSEETPSEG